MTLVFQDPIQPSFKRLDSGPPWYDSSQPNGSGGGGGVPDGLNASGTVGHGNTMTVTDSDSRFGTRTNTKPVYVNLGDGKTGSSLGRQTGDFFASDASYGTSIKLGSLSGSVRRDMDDSDAAFGGIDVGAGAKPFIHYVERYYDFLNDADGTNGSGELNLKTNRWWDNGQVNTNFLVAFQFGDTTLQGRTSVPSFTEQDEGLPSRYYWGSRPFEGRAWQSEEYILKQSSDVDILDGRFIHIKNATQRNNRELFVTRTASDSEVLQEVYLDQISNGTGVENSIYYGYQVLDDEYPGVYVGDASTRSSCTRLVRQPQTSWASGEIQFQQVESAVSLSNGYLYFRTGIDTWLSDDGVAL